MEVQPATLRVQSHEISALTRKLDTLVVRTYPSKGLQRFIKEELLPVNEALRAIVVAEEEALKRNDGSHQPSRVTNTLTLWAGLRRIVNAVAGADLRSHPLEVMQYLKDVVTTIEGKDHVEFITSPSEVMNFSFREVWQTYKSALGTYAGIQRPTNTRFIHFTFPELHKDNALLGAIYAHELGHYLDRQKNLTEQILVEAVKHQNITALAQALKTSVPDIAAFLSSSFLGPWIREIIADTIGLHLLGPAFHFAAAYIDAYYASKAYPKLSDLVGESHPASALRSEHRVTMLRKLGFLDACSKQVQDEIVASNDWWVKAERVYAKPEHDQLTGMVEPFVNLCEPVLMSVMPLIIKTVDEMLPTEVRLTVADLRDVVPPLVSERLTWLIPPNELGGQPVSPAAIFNAGWVTYHTGLGAIRERVKEYEPDEKLFDLVELINNLVRFALNTSRVQRRLADLDRVES